MFSSLWRLIGSLTLATLLVVPAGCEKQPGTSSGGSASKRLIFLINNPDPFWDACRAGLMEGGKKFDLEQAGLSVSMESNDGTAQGQIDKLRQYASQSDIVGVAISVIQADNVA